MTARSRGIGRTAVVLVVIVLVAVGGSALYFVLGDQPSSKVSVMLNFTPSATHSPFYYGVAAGYYRDNGINLTILPGRNDGAPISAVATNQVQFGITEVPNLVLDVANSNITNVRVVAVLVPRTLYAVIYNKATIHTLADLSGKTAGEQSPTSGGLAPILFGILAEENGINMSSITFNYASAPIHNAELVDGKIDFTVTTVQQLPILQSAAAKNGIQLGEFPFADYGINTYGLSLITSTRMIQQHSDLVARFVKATLQSFEGASSDPSATASALIAAEPQLNYTQALLGFQDEVNCCYGSGSSVTNPLQLGWISPNQMQQTVSFTVTALGITRQVNAADIYTDAYVVQP